MERMDLMNALSANGLDLELASDDLKNDPDIVLEAVKQNGRALKFASKEVKNNPEVVREAVNQNGSALLYASVQMKTNTEIVLVAVKKKGGALLYASDSVKGNPEIVLEAVKQNGTALMYASKELKNDPAVVLEAVRQAWGALDFASDRLKGDTKIVLEAVKQSGLALKFALDALKCDHDFILQCSKYDAQCLLYVSDELKDNPVFVQKAVHGNSKNQMYASSNIGSFSSVESISDISKQRAGSKGEDTKIDLKEEPAITDADAFWRGHAAEVVQAIFRQKLAARAVQRKMKLQSSSGQATEEPTSNEMKKKNGSQFLSAVESAVAIAAPIVPDRKATWEQMLLEMLLKREESPKPHVMSYKSAEHMVKDQFVLPIPFSGRGTQLYCSFKTDYDIGFEATLLNNATGEKSTIVPHARIQSHKEPECFRRGPFNDIESGLVLLRWDNSYSYFRSKKLSYYITVQWDERPNVEEKIEIDRGEIDACMKELQNAESLRQIAHAKSENHKSELTELQDSLRQLQEKISRKTLSIVNSEEEGRVTDQRAERQRVNVKNVVLSMVVGAGWV